jgi:hypothetical protein
MIMKLLKMSTAVVAALLIGATSAQAGYTIKKKVGDVDTKFTLFGFSQLEAVGGDGMKIKNAGSVKKADSDVNFRAQRIRLGWKYVAGQVRGKVFLDFNQKHNDPDATNGAALSNMVKDAFISYVVDPAFVVKAGLIKMPNGMGFTMPGWNLDIAERGFDKSLVLERNIGLMFSGRAIGGKGKVNGFEMGHERPWTGFGYDIMIANQASRSKAAGSSDMGGNAYAVRAMYDYTEKIHFETSYAVSQNAGGFNAIEAELAENEGKNEDYNNINIGIDSNLGALSLKAEHFIASNIKGIKDYNEAVTTATVGYFVTPSVELVTKYMMGTAEKGTKAKETELTNAYIGLNLFISSPSSDLSRKAKRTRNQHKVVLNYIVAGGSGATEEAADKWTGLGGYRDDAFIAQYQFKF